MKKALIWIAVVIVGAGLWAWYDLKTKPANDRIQSGVRQIIREYPSLRPMYTDAMKDGVFTTSEALEIINKAQRLKGY